MANINQIQVGSTVYDIEDQTARNSISNLADVASSGDYGDLSNKPTIPTALSDFGVTASASELNVLDGITASTAELNYTDGVTSNIQTQLDAKPDTADLLQMTSKTVAASGWTAETKTSTSGTSYTYYYRFAVTGITANDFVDASIASGTYTGNWAVESTSGYIYIHTAIKPTASLTFNIYYKVGM